MMRLLPSSCRSGLFTALWLLASATTVPAMAQGATGADAPGAKDHPLVQRFAGSWLIGYHHSDWEQITLPTGPAVANRKFQQSVTLEGQVTQLVYVAPKGKSALEVYRNYEQALKGAGLRTQFTCETDCHDLYFAWYEGLDVVTRFRWSKESIPSPSGGRFSAYSAIAPEGGRFLYGTLARAGREVHVLLYTGAAVNPTTEAAGTTLTIVEPKPMQTGQVTVDAKALQSGLASEGKIALYGIYFDTGKAVLKPESKPQLDQMGQLLRAQPALKVYIVGHTDNVGALEPNLALSQQRAQAVARALVSGHQVDARRLVAKGVANLAPVSANTAEEGRARNRRVELVAQ